MRPDDAIAVLVAPRRVTLETGALTVREDVRRCLEAGGRRLLIDLSGCDYMDSAGLGEIATALIRVRKAGGRLGLVSPKPRVRELLQLARLLEIFDVFDDEAQARAGVA